MCVEVVETTQSNWLMEATETKLLRFLRVHQEAAIVANLAIALTIIVLLATDILTRESRNFGRAGDHNAYIAMAKGNPLDATELKGTKCYMVPYCWRIATPVMAKILPFDLQSNFLLIAIVSTALTGVTTYYLAKAFGFSPIFAFIGMLMFFSMRWGAKWGLFDFWIPDALGLLIIVAAVYCVITKNDIGFAILITLGVTVRETTVLVAPLYYTFNARKPIDLRIAVRLLLLTLPSIAVLIGLRIAIPSSGFTAQDEDVWARIGRIMAVRIRAFELPSGLRRYALAPFGVMMALLPFFSPKRNAALLLKFLPFILLCYGQLLLASNTERLLVVAFPAVLILALHGLSHFATIMAIDPRYLAILPLSSLAIHLITDSATRFEPSYVIHMQIWSFLLGLVLIFAIRDFARPHQSRVEASLSPDT